LELDFTMPMRQQNPQERIRNFFEVALGYSKEDAQKEAERCLLCKEPLCVQGCPVEIDIPAFIKLLREDKPQEALSKIKEKNNLPAVCGRVCPQEDQCEGRCILNKKKVPINIGALERYAADYGKVHSQKGLSASDHRLSIKIAVVGSGPAGLTAAADLAKMRYSVTLFESLHVPGGVLSYGIPEFRLPKEIVHEEIAAIKNLGVELKTDILIGKTFSLVDLFEAGYKAIFLGLGAGLPQFMGIPGENLDRVYSANEFLTRVNLMRAYKFPEFKTPVSIGKKIAVIGGGNVAFDSARCGARLGSQVSIIYRRGEAEMPARHEEIQNAKEEGITFQLLTQPVKIIGLDTGFVSGVECVKMQLGDPDSSGRRRPVAIAGSNFVLDADTVIIAIGQTPNPLLAKVTPELKTTPRGTVIIDKNYMTSIHGVFAGGDITTGADTVIAAMGAGKRAARAIDHYIKKVESRMAEIKKTTIQDILSLKNKRKITMLTAYDYPLALLVDRAGIDMILVGDSLANVVLGLDSTTKVGMNEMLHHAKAVSRAVTHSLVIGDMPYESYQLNPGKTVENAKRFIEEARCDCVKLEWFDQCLEVTEKTISSGVSVMGHIGLTPQTADKLGGFKVQGKDAQAAQKLIDQARALENAGCFAIVLECVPDKIAEIITQKLTIPTIGIGAGMSCDGQVLVTHDMLGLFERFTPKFVKKYLDLGPLILKAIEEYKNDVLQKRFPGQEHSFSIKNEELIKLKT